jgi:dTDP-4-amino-4,6-dideoxygalactose transaminase
MTEAAVSRTVIAGRPGRLFVAHGTKLTLVPVRVTLVSGTQAAVEPLRGSLAPGDQVVVADTASANAVPTSPALRAPIGPNRGGLR